MDLNDLENPKLNVIIYLFPASLFSLAYSGGIATAVNYVRKGEKSDADQNALTYTLHPQDLTTFTRKAMFVVVDSNNSTSFKSFQKVFNQPFVCLLSPVEYPSSIKGDYYILILIRNFF